MPASDTFANDLAKLIFWGTAIADLAENDSSSPATSLYLALHTANPGGAGNQSTSEISYTSYIRKALLRDNTAWSITGRIITPVADVLWATSTGGTGGTVTHWSVGPGSSGATKIIAYGTVSPTFNVVTDVTPTLSNLTSLTIN